MIDQDLFVILWAVIWGIVGFGLIAAMTPSDDEPQTPTQTTRRREVGVKMSFKRWVLYYLLELIAIIAILALLSYIFFK